MTIRFGNAATPSTYVTPSSPALQQSMLGLGSLAVQNSTAVAITGGSIAGASLNSSNVDLWGGKINGVVLGATLASSASFTGISLSSNASVIRMTASSAVSASSAAITNGLTASSATFTNGVAGTGTTGNAATGVIGEYIDSAFTSTALTTATYTDVGTVTLSAGDWDLEAILFFSGAAGTIQTSAILFIGEVSGNNSTGLVIGTNFVGDNGLSLTNAAKTVCLPRLRKQPASNTTYYLKAYSAFTVSTMAVSGILTARRVR